MKTQNNKNHFYGKKHTPETKKKMKEAWAKRKLRPTSFTPEVRKKMSVAHLGEKSYLWKGDKVGYHGLHKWIKKEKGKACQCEHCGVKDSQYQWANKTGLYLREINDWFELCLKCHRAYDRSQIKPHNRVIGRGTNIKLAPL